jgi:cell wall assembly regulator SMI1
MRSWIRIESWLAANAPDQHAALRPSATGESLRKLEHGTLLTLPSDARASYLRHDGQNPDAPPALGRWWLLRLDVVLDTWNRLKESQHIFDQADRGIEPVGAVRKRYWNPRWLPALADGESNFLCFDLDPAPGGRRGQLIWFQRSNRRREVVAPSLDAWLDRLGGELERGKWALDPEGRLAAVPPQ